MTVSPPELWNDSLSGFYLWSNTNFGEAVTETMTPLTWSVLRFTLEDWIFIPGFPTVGNIGGTPYVNISIFASLFQALGRSQVDLLSALEATLNLQLPEGLEIPLLERSRWRLLPAVLATLRTGTRQQMGRVQLTAYLRQNSPWFQAMSARIRAEQDPAALARLWQAEIHPHVKQGVWCTLGSVTATMDYTMPLRRDISRLAGEEAAAVLISSLSASSSPLPSLGPVLGIYRLARGELSRQDYLEGYGHRGPHEFELSVPRPAEDPTWLDEQLDQYRCNPVDVPALLEKQARSFQSAWEQLAQRHPRQAGTFKRRIAESARLAHLREETRSAYVRDRWLVRLFALRTAELTGMGNDVFFLTLEELLETLSGVPVPDGLVAQRRADHAAYQALPAYPSVILGPFDPFSTIASTGQSPAEAMVERKIHGSPGSSGVVEGRVRLLRSLDEAAALQPGEVLVTTFTDIGWTPLFPRLAAVVTDVGAVLSHAAIVARELGIPAVVGCRDATSRLHTGDCVRVDGGQGIVTILQGVSDDLK